MKKLLCLLAVVSIVILFAACPQTNAGGSGNASLSEADKVDLLNRAKGSLTIDNLFEAELNRVLGKEWISYANVYDAQGGKDKAAYQGSLFFDGTKFRFTSYLLDGGIKSEKFTNNADYAKYTNVAQAALSDGANIFETSLHIVAIRLPLLNQYLAWEKEDEKLDGTTAPVTGGTVTGDAPAGGGAITDGKFTGGEVNITLKKMAADDPMIAFFKDANYSAGGPNIVIDAEVEVKGSGTDKFKRNVNDLSRREQVRFIIKNGKLTITADRLNIEDPTLDTVRGGGLYYWFRNYYVDLDDVRDTAPNVFSPAEPYSEPQKADGTKQIINDTAIVQNKFANIVNLVRNTAVKRNLKTDAFTWGYLKDDGTKVDTMTDALVNKVFNPGNIRAIMADTENPAFDPKLPEHPTTNPKFIESSLPPLTQAVPDPVNINIAHENWKLNTNIGSPAIIKDNIPSIAGTMVWDILYGDGSGDYVSAKFTVKREVVGYSDKMPGGADWDPAPVTGKKYRSNEWEASAPAKDFLTVDNPSNWKEKNYTGKAYGWKERYTMSLEFADPNAAVFGYIWGNQILPYGKKYEVVYEPKTTNNPMEFENGYTVEPYSVMEKTFKRTREYLEFDNIQIWGVNEVESAAEKIIATIYGDAVLNTQTHFFVPMTDKGLKFTKITKFKITPKHENVLFTFNPAGFGLSEVTWEARQNENNMINTSKPGGTKEFTVNGGDLNLANKIAGRSLTVALSGLAKHSAAGKEGIDRTNNNLTQEWMGYTFVVHFGR